MTGKEFANWMDSHGVTNHVAAELFGVSEQNIYNWRSTRGVPPSKESWVKDRMAEVATKRSEEAPERVSLEITREQFADWNRAALRAGKIIYDWAAEVLDEAAAQEADTSTGSSLPFNPLASLKVAEPGTPYGQQAPKDKE